MSKKRQEQNNPEAVSKRAKRETRSPRRVFREAKIRAREARKLLRRARKKLPEQVRETLASAIRGVQDTRRDRDAVLCQEAIEDLDGLVEEHLARYRKGALREYAESIGLAILFALILRAFVVEAFQIPSESMVPTLLVGDHLFVNKFVYGLRIPFTRFDIIDFGDPEPGDVVVFIYPVEEVRTEVTIGELMLSIRAHENRSADGLPPESLTAIGKDDVVDDWGAPFHYERTEAGFLLASLGPDGVLGTFDDLTSENSAIQGHTDCISRQNLIEAKDYIKRVIGVAGDRIRVEDSVIYRNGEPVPHELATDTETEVCRRRSRPRRIGHMVHSVERIEDAEYTVQYCDSLDDFEEITVREDHIFVMGDNRDNSSDSRCWGQVPIENVKGEALFLFWSGGEDGGFLGNRWERMFDAVD